MSSPKPRIPDSPLVPYPSGAYVPERDVKEIPVLETHHLGIDFGGLTAVDDFSLTIGKTEIAGLIGPNGAGKTTVFNLLTNVYTPTRGSIMINGFSSAGKTTAQVNKMGIARTFQNIRLFSNMSVLDNVRVGLHNATKENLVAAITHGFGYRKAERQSKQAALDLLNIFALEQLEERTSWEPSRWRTAPAGNRSRASHPAQDPAAGRTCRRHEPFGNPGGSWTTLEKSAIPLESPSC